MSVTVNDLQRKYDELDTAIEAWRKRSRTLAALIWATVISMAMNLAACIYTLLHVHHR